MLRRRWRLALLCLVVLPTGVYALAASQPNVYEARVIVEGEPRPAFTQVGTVSIADPQSIRLARTQATAAGIIRNSARLLRRPYSSMGTVTATLDDRTGWLTLSVSDSSPGRAVATANVLPLGLRQNVREIVRSEVDAAISEIERTRAAVRTPDERAQLTETLRDLRAIDPSRDVSLPVVERAESAERVAPNPYRDAALALVLAILVAPTLMLAGERWDRRVRHAQSLPELAAAPLLTTIDAATLRGVTHAREQAEAFAQLRDSLTYLNSEVELRVISIASAFAHDGRTQVASHLAQAFARAGQRVVVVDGDLRGPGVARRPGNGGLSDALTGADVENVIQRSRHGAADFDVVSAGSPVENPGELLGSARMSRLLERLTAQYEIVIVETTPLLAVSDALPLLRQTSGVLCVVPLDRTPGDAVRRLTGLIRNAGGRVLGVVAIAGAPRSPRARRRSRRSQHARVPVA